jgi:hypothetical protein
VPQLTIWLPEPCDALHSENGRGRHLFAASLRDEVGMVDA